MPRRRGGNATAKRRDAIMKRMKRSCRPSRFRRKQRLGLVGQCFVDSSALVSSSAGLDPSLDRPSKLALTDSAVYSCVFCGGAWPAYYTGWKHLVLSSVMFVA